MSLLAEVCFVERSQDVMFLDALDTTKLRPYAKGCITNM